MTSIDVTGNRGLLGGFVTAVPLPGWRPGNLHNCPAAGVQTMDAHGRAASRTTSAQTSTSLRRPARAVSRSFS